MSEPQTFIIHTDRVRANALEAVRTAAPEWVVTVAPPGRSTPQNAMFHAICSDIAKSGQLFLKKPRKAAVWKVLLISAHAAATGDGNEIVPGLEGEFVNIRESSALMSVRRAASLITYCLAYCDTNQIPLHETRRGGFLDQQAAA